MDQIGINQMNMNQMGINQMNMNQMGINQMNMNQMGMNNQFNQINEMDMNTNTTLNIKNIVQPYEKKIKELEEIIRQKDFEITVLKHKLNNNNSKNNFMNMNMDINPMMINNNINPMMMMENNNQQFENKGKKIEITIKSDDNEFKFKCLDEDKIFRLIEKYNIKGGGLTYNYKVINTRFTFRENGIVSDSIIYVKKNCRNIKFRKYNGSIQNIAVSDDCPLVIAIINYLITFDNNPFYFLHMINGKEYLNNKIHFQFMDSNLNIKDETPIGIFFRSFPDPTVWVSYS